MMSRKPLLFFVIMVILSEAACTKNSNTTTSNINVFGHTNPGEPSFKDIHKTEVEGKLFEIKKLIKEGEGTYEDDYRESSYWGIKINPPFAPPAPPSNEVIANFYFKKNDHAVGPDIAIEFSDSDEMLNFYLSSYAAAKGSFATANAHNKHRVLEAFYLLSKQRQVGQKIIPLSSALIELANLLDSPAVIKKYDGKDPQGRACQVEGTYDLDGQLYNIKIGYKNVRDKYTKINLFFGPFPQEGQTCTDLEIDLTAGNKNIKNQKFGALGITYESLTSEHRQSAGNFSGSESARSFFGGILLSSAACTTTKFTLCRDQAQVQRVRYYGGVLTLLPLLGGAVKENIAIDCQNLIPKS